MLKMTGLASPSPPPAVLLLLDTTARALTQPRAQPSPARSVLKAPPVLDHAPEKTRTCTLPFLLYVSPLRHKGDHTDGVNQVFCSCHPRLLGNTARGSKRLDPTRSNAVTAPR
jgi:hypothetical protein